VTLAVAGAAQKAEVGHGIGPVRLLDDMVNVRLLAGDNPAAGSALGAVAGDHGEAGPPPGCGAVAPSGGSRPSQGSADGGPIGL